MPQRPHVERRRDVALGARRIGRSSAEDLMGRRFLLLPAESEDELSRGDGVLVSPLAAAQPRFSRCRVCRFGRLAPKAHRVVFAHSAGVYSSL